MPELVKHVPARLVNNIRSENNKEVEEDWLTADEDDDNPQIVTNNSSKVEDNSFKSVQDEASGNMNEPTESSVNQEERSEKYVNTQAQFPYMSLLLQAIDSALVNQVFDQGEGERARLEILLLNAKREQEEQMEIQVQKHPQSKENGGDNKYLIDNPSLTCWNCTSRIENDDTSDDSTNTTPLVCDSNQADVDDTIQTSNNTLREQNADNENCFSDDSVQEARDNGITEQTEPKDGYIRFKNDTSKRCKGKPPGMLSVKFVDSNVKQIHEPKLLRPRVIQKSSSDFKSKRSKQRSFRFSEYDIVQNTPDIATLGMKYRTRRSIMNASPRHFSVPTVSTPSRMKGSIAIHQRMSLPNCYSSNLMWRRKSLSIIKSPVKSSSMLSSPAKLLVRGPDNRLSSRRNSTSYNIANTKSYGNHTKVKLNVSPSLSYLTVAVGKAEALSTASSSKSQPAVASSTSTTVVRVRERKSDGHKEVVITKRKQLPIVWYALNRQVQSPLIMPLGPLQHGIMLRQLRYVKSVMHEFPWAKSLLRHLLSAYTKKQLSKEELYPKLNMLGQQVAHDLVGNMKKQRSLLQKKQYLSLQLTIATGVLNELDVVKFGRFGKPHETKLHYDPGNPLYLYWFRKTGERSDEYIELAYTNIQSVSSQWLLNTKNSTPTFKRIAKRDPECCIVLETPERTLELRLITSLHRDWMVNALTDVVQFAKQYKASGAMARRQVHTGKRI